MHQKITKNLTILFADIVGSSKLYDVLGDKKAQKIIAQVLQFLSQVVIENEGVVCKTIGDEIMCVFTKPDHAALTALAIHEGLRTASFEDLPREQIFVRIGFYHGQVVETDGDFFGNAVNIAARLVASSKAKQIITTKSTIDSMLVQDQFSIRFLEKTTVKGIQDEFEIYEMLSSDDPEKITRVVQDESKRQAAFESRLIVIYNKQQTILDKERPTLNIGRGMDNDIIIFDDSISRLHATLELRRGKFILVDKSLNGTFIETIDRKYYSLHRDEKVLEGKGKISLGIAFDSSPKEMMTYLIESIPS